MLLVALLLVALPAVTVAAEAGHDCDGCGKAGMRSGEGMRMGRRAGLGLRGVELTEAQRQKLDELRAEQVKALATVRADLEVKATEMVALWRAEKLEARKLVAKVREISGLREKLEVARVNLRVAMLELLTPEQREQLRAAGREGERRGKGMGGEGRKGRGMRGQGRQGDCQGDCENCSGHGEK